MWSRPSIITGKNFREVSINIILYYIPGIITGSLPVYIIVSISLLCFFHFFLWKGKLYIPGIGIFYMERE